MIMKISYKIVTVVIANFVLIFMIHLSGPCVIMILNKTIIRVVIVVSATNEKYSLDVKHNFKKTIFL